ncbi:hypothetical protein R3P38DRAFT_2788366 [Favolaschia claudopus]|uniref:Uncharacterized protein n=1 Tax=Favolaschia claudopus TaxID=2862362 RepID=A0AAW0AMY7_9AGAR
MDSADEYDEYFEFGHFTPEAEQEIARIEREALGACSPSTRAFTNCVDICTLPPPSNTLLSAEQLKDASKKSGAHVFFSKRETFAYEADSDDEDMDSENEDDESEPRGARNKEKVVDGGKAEGHARMAIYIVPQNHTTVGVSETGYQASPAAELWQEYFSRISMIILDPSSS